MAFLRAPIRAPASPRVRVAVFAVGRRVYVAGARVHKRPHLPSGEQFRDDLERVFMRWGVGPGSQRAADDLPPAWMKNALVAIEGIGNECC